MFTKQLNDFTKLLDQYQEHAYLLFRVLVGAVFMLHGLQKFGILKATFALPTAPLMLIAGTIEIVVGALVILGLFTRYCSILGALLMLAALGIAHVPRGVNPLANGGEPALLFFAAFLVLVAYGAGSWSMDKKLLKKAA